MKSIDKVTTCHYHSDRLSLYCHVHWRDVCRLYAAKALSERSRTGLAGKGWWEDADGAVLSSARGKKGDDQGSRDQGILPGAF